MLLLRAARWHKEINNHFLSFSYGWTEGKDGGKRERERERENLVVVLWLGLYASVGC